MPHLASFRKGWENENLARFILSRFSFVAHPSSVADDVGSDFFCTLFQIKKKDKKSYLVPKNSFAIQIKSNKLKFDVFNKKEYLNDLEIPFFAGVADQRNLKLTIYSGQYIPALFSYVGPMKKLKIELLDEVDPRSYYRALGDKDYVIRFPKVMEIMAKNNTRDLQIKVVTLSEICSMMQENIASKKNSEFIFKYKVKRHLHLLMFAGSGSAKVFRENFLNRLAEVFYNFEWIYKNNPEELNMEEFEIYKGLFNQLINLYPTKAIPPLLIQQFISLERVIGGDE